MHWQSRFDNYQVPKTWGYTLSDFFDDLWEQDVVEFLQFTHFYYGLAEGLELV